jgi:hypothetical protein
MEDISASTIVVNDKGGKDSWIKIKWFLDTDSEHARRYFLSYRIGNVSWDYITNILTVSRHDSI